MVTLSDVSNLLSNDAGTSHYDAFKNLWDAWEKLCHLEKRTSSTKSPWQMLVSRIPDAKVKEIVTSQYVDVLLNLDPPLHAIQSDPLEDLKPTEVGNALKKIRTNQCSNPREAIHGLAVILKNIRNVLLHSFKSTDPGSRDGQILGTARHILDQVCRAALEARPCN